LLLAVGPSTGHRARGRKANITGSDSRVMTAQKRWVQGYPVWRLSTPVKSDRLAGFPVERSDL
jgi:hypothetical protein